MKVFYSPEYMAAKYAFDTTRKSGHIAQSLLDNPIPGVELVAPNPLTEADIMEVHSPAYVKAVKFGEPRRLAETQGFQWDEGIFRGACYSNGGMVDAAISAMQDGVAGSLSSGMHHAKYNEGCGACTFNGLVFAALVAIQNGAKRVLVLDLDAHCGGGTHDILKNYENVWIADVSTHPGDFWRSTSSRHILKVVDSAEKYSQTVKKVFEDICFDAMKDQPVTSTGRAFDLIIYNAGMDVYEKSNYNGIGLSKEIIIERERMVFNWAKGYNMPIMFALAGGYIDKNFTQEELTELHRLTIAEAAKK